MLNVLFIAANGVPKRKVIEDGLKPMQDLVGGYIEFRDFIVEGEVYSAVVNEEGLLMGLPYNLTLDGVPLVGDLFITRTDAKTGNSLSLTEADFDRLDRYFGVATAP